MTPKQQKIQKLIDRLHVAQEKVYDIIDAAGDEVPDFDFSNLATIADRVIEEVRGQLEVALGEHGEDCDDCDDEDDWDDLDA